jgi:hypothetical protein
MAITASRYGHVGGQFAAANINWVTHTIKVALCASGYTPDLDNHEYFSSVTNELAAGNGYTVGGAILGTKTTAYVPADDQTALRAANTVWTPGAGETLTARYAVVYRDTGSAATSPLIVLVDFGVNLSATGASLTIDWNDTGGVFKI